MKLMIDIPDETYNKMRRGETLYHADANVAIFAIETGNPIEECGDCISKQAVLDLMRERDEELSSICPKDIRDLPPVNPEPKMGHWIIYDVHGHKACKCSECNSDVGYPCTNKYCRHCGTKMEERK